MMALVPICFTFLAGLTLCGLVGSALELATGRRLSFGEPFVANGHVLRSLAATAGAGPFMLVNEALAAWRRRHVPTLFMLVSAFSGLERMKAAYAHAIGAGYRFYSYGDACLLERATDA